MNANMELHRVKEWIWMRGFTNLYKKESRVWWSTRRWWINALLWTGLIVGLVAVWVFVLPATYRAYGITTIDDAGGPVALGFEMLFNAGGGMMLVFGVIILCQDLIVGEKQNGLTSWLLACPVQRKAYVLAKLSATLVSILVLLVVLPCTACYVLLSVAAGEPLALQPYLEAAGIVLLNCLFYMTLMIMLGTFFNSRLPVLGVSLGIVLVGMFFSGFLQPLLYVTPWALPGFAKMIAMQLSIPSGMLWPPLISTATWCLVFTILAIIKFERTEF
jgi:ABC-type transport system involved in multi-copper enzyme maturation permease subunit